MFKKGVVPSQGLRIIIVGCGKVGRTLVEQLGKEGHDITIVDKNRERISQVSNIYDVMGIAGNRSEERRVGKECLRLCRSRWSPYH